MQFELPRTTAHFACANLREEKNVGKAFDLPFTLTTSADILLMLCPAQIETDDPDADPQEVADDKDRLIQELFSVEGFVKRPALNPLHINRKPEGITVTIHDQEEGIAPLILKPCRFTTLQAELESPHQVVLKGKIQYSQYNNNELIRMNAIMGEHCDIEWVTDQQDMFSGETESEDDAQAAESKTD